MQQVIVYKLDWYIKIVLTVIAIALVVMILKPLFTSERASASGDIQAKTINVNLNIDKVGGQKVLRWWEAERVEKGIPLYIEGKVTTEKPE
ncbi:hypothetical protein J7J45_02410 [Candidatus Aerophobetes bacterium]|nr:hypothetical protein [Candidatus Aerophobetes bacterium]